MTNLLIMLGIVTLVAWVYAGITAVAYATVFRRAYSWDRLRLSAIWPVSVPMFVVARIWLRLRRRPRLIPRAQVRKSVAECGNADLREGR